MKSTLIFLCLLPVLGYAQLDTSDELFKTMQIQDSVFFERGFNLCDIEYLENHITEDLKFFHDQSGFQDRYTFLDNTRKYLCANTDLKPIRKVDTSSLELFPLYDNGKLYAAIQKGVHHFYLRAAGKEDLWTSTARFTHVWVLEDEVWKVSEVLSYDHQVPNSKDD